jgi:Protein of unknown function (DUF4238)
MAGIRHHILPRFLLKGFASKVDNKKVFTWIYEKDKVPCERSTKDVGVEKHFYGRQGELNIDDDITQLEPKLAEYLNDITQYSEGRIDINKREVVELVVHLFMRTRYLCEVVTQAIQETTITTKNALLDDEKLKNFVLKSVSKEIVKDKVDKEIDKCGVAVNKNHRELLYQIFEDSLPQHIDSKLQDLQLMSEGLFSQMTSSIEQNLRPHIRESYIEVLSEDLIPEPILRLTFPVKFGWPTASPQLDHVI